MPKWVPKWVVVATAPAEVNPITTAPAEVKVNPIKALDQNTIDTRIKGIDTVRLNVKHGIPHNQEWINANLTIGAINEPNPREENVSKRAWEKKCKEFRNEVRTKMQEAYKDYQRTLSGDALTYENELLLGNLYEANSSGSASPEADPDASPASPEADPDAGDAGSAEVGMDMGNMEMETEANPNAMEMEMETWTWRTWTWSWHGHGDMETWSWHGHGDMETWPWSWRHGHGVGMEMETWPWSWHGHGDGDMENMEMENIEIDQPIPMPIRISYAEGLPLYDLPLYEGLGLPLVGSMGPTMGPIQIWPGGDDGFMGNEFIKIMFNNDTSQMLGDDVGVEHPAIIQPSSSFEAGLPVPQSPSDYHSPAIITVPQPRSLSEIFFSSLSER